MLIKNIKWDTDGDMEALASLPTEGWCHFGFETETDDGGIIKCDTLPE